jgi:hypothetical protein
VSEQVTRIVLAIDTADRTAQLVRDAVELASRFGVELEGLFVEDEALLRLAAHDFARRYGGLEAGRGFDPADIEHEWRALARAVRRAIEREAERRRVGARMTVARGAIAAALEERLARGELVVVGWGCSAAARERGPVRVLYDGGTSSRRALDIAARLAGEDGVVVAWMPAALADLDVHAAEIERALRGRVARARIVAGDTSPSGIRHAVAAEPGGVLVVPAEHELARRLEERSPSARFSCSVLVVR